MTFSSITVRSLPLRLQTRAYMLSHSSTLPLFILEKAEALGCDATRRVHAGYCGVTSPDAKQASANTPRNCKYLLPCCNYLSQCRKLTINLFGSGATVLDTLLFPFCECLWLFPSPRPRLIHSSPFHITHPSTVICPLHPPSTRSMPTTPCCLRYRPLHRL